MAESGRFPEETYDFVESWLSILNHGTPLEALAKARAMKTFLDDLERGLVTECFDAGITNAQIAAVLGVTREAVRQKRAGDPPKPRAVYKDFAAAAAFAGTPGLYHFRSTGETISYQTRGVDPRHFLQEYRRVMGAATQRARRP